MSMLLADFRIRFPAFADLTLYPTAVLDPILQEASRCVNDAFFRARADDAHGYLSAHLAITTLPTAASLVAMASGVKNVSAGTVSVTYADAMTGEALTLTPYGREYLRLVKLGGGARLASGVLGTSSGCC